MRPRSPTLLLKCGLCSLVLAAAGCSDDDTSCDLEAQTGCDGAQVCEAVAGSEPACFDPVIVEGRVFDLLSGDGIEAARVVALDINGAPMSAFAESDADGSYSLQVPTPRSDSSGAYEAQELTLRADALAYQSFPSGLRPALPLDTGSAIDDGDRTLLSSDLTDIALQALPEGTGRGIISGQVETAGTSVGILVVAESDGGPARTSVAAADGSYQLVNVPSGEVNVQAYALGQNYLPASVQMSAGGSAEVDLSLSDAAVGTVTGNVQIVNAPGGSATSVILVVESTFDETFGRGQALPGLRDPLPGIVADVDGDYEFVGVPVGRYVVLAAFENDGLVRDPDTSIGGTATLHIEVGPGETTEVEGFKVTEALQMVSPGADGPEEVLGTPVFEWADDSSEDEYVVQVFNAFGEVIWEQSIPGVSGAQPSLEYAGPALASGGYYQVRVTSFKGSALSRTEDLKGVFYTP